nr:HIT family protein [Oceanobacillus picturae]
MLDHSPYNEGHVLILPKAHFRFFDELDEHTAASLVEATKKVSKVIRELYRPDGITICQNGGAFDELTHFHMHVVPRYEGQNFAKFYSEDEANYIEDRCKLEATKRKMEKALLELP